MHKLAYIINVKFNPYYAFKGFAGASRGRTDNTAGRPMKINSSPDLGIAALSVFNLFQIKKLAIILSMDAIFYLNYLIIIIY